MSERLEYCCQPQAFPEPRFVYFSMQIALNELITLPEAKPDIEQLIEVVAHPFIDEWKIIPTPSGRKVLVRGHIEQKILYVADVPSQSVHAAHSTASFCAFKEIVSDCHQSSPPHLCCPGVLVEYLSAHKIGRRQLEKCVLLFIWFARSDHPHCSPGSYGSPCCCRCTPGVSARTIHLQALAKHEP